MTPWIVRNYNDWMQVGQKLTPMFDGQPFQVTVKRFKRDRTLDQNAKVHAMLRDLALFTGYSERQMKDICKAQFAPMVARQIGGNTVHTPKGTSEMNVEEMSNFIEALQAQAADIGCVFSD